MARHGGSRHTPRHERIIDLNAMFASAANVALLALESQQAMHLRLYHLGLGGPKAIDEASLMVREKIEAFTDAMGAAMAGGSFESMIGDYRAIVRANIERLKIAG